MFSDDPFIEECSGPVKLGFLWEMVDKKLSPLVTSLFRLVMVNSIANIDGVLNTAVVSLYHGEAGSTRSP